MLIKNAFRYSASPAAITWPFAFPLTRDKNGQGSSTMAGVNPTEKSPFKVSVDDGYVSGGALYAVGGSEPASGGVYVINGGAGSTVAEQIRDALIASSARRKAADQVWQLGGNYKNVGAGLGTDQNPVPDILTHAQTMAATVGHDRFVHIPKHHDNNGDSLTVDWHRIRRITRGLRALYPGKVQDAGLRFRNTVTGVVGDDVVQMRDEIPLSLANDPAHANLAGNRRLALDDYLPWWAAMEDLLAFIPDQHVFSTEATNQTLDGFVANIEYDNTIAGTLTGVTVEVVGSAHFRASVVGSDIKLYRASGTYLGDGYYTITLKQTKSGHSKTSLLRVYLGMLTGTGAYRAQVNGQALMREGPVNGVTSCTKFSLVIGVKPLAGWDAAAGAAAKQFFAWGPSSFRVDIAMKGTANLNAGIVLRNAAGTSVYNLDTLTTAGNKINEANGIQWICLGVDFETGAYNQSVGANASQTTGASGIAGGTGQSVQIATAIDNAVNYLFTNGIGTGSIGRSPLIEIVAIAAYADYIDFGVAGGLRAKVFDATTKASVLNTVRGGDAPGVVNGIAPFYWCEGPAPNWQMGINLADPTDTSEFFDCSDRDNLVMLTTAA